MNNKTVMVYTENTLKDCIERGGVGWWTIGDRTVDKIKYAIITVKGGVDNKAAKFAVKVKGHIKHPDPLENRVMLTFDEAALIDVPNAWPGNRNPLTYVDATVFGIDFDKLEWEAVPVGIAKGENRSNENLMEHFDKLTIKQIKEGLARRFSVAAAAIEINVKA